MYYILAILFMALSLGVLTLIDRKIKANTTTVMKVLSIVLVVLFFVWYLIPGRFISPTTNLEEVFSGNVLRNYTSTEGPLPEKFKVLFGTRFMLIITLIAVWLFVVLHVITVLIPFFGNFKIAKYIEKFVSPIILVFDIITIPNIVTSFAGHSGFSVIGLLISLEIGLIGGKLVFSFAFKDHDFHFEKSMIKEFVVAILIMIFFSTPVFAPQAIFGNIKILESANGAVDFTTFHRFYIYITFGYLLFFTILLRHKKGEYARMVLLFVTMAAMITYSDQFSFLDFPHPWSWPLHICNTAMYILPIALATKSEKVFYFTFFINILGAFLAILMPSYSSGYHFLAYRPIQFWLNHVEAAMMPLVCVLTGVFNRPTKKQFFYSMVGFCGYYILAIVLNTILTAYHPIYVAKTGFGYGDNGVVDFFFINSDYVAKKLHAEALLTNFGFNFTLFGMECTMYPLYQLLYFLSFVALSIGMWFFYVYLFKAQDKLIEVDEKYRKVKFDELALLAKHNKKEVSECMSEISKNKLIISHFSKRYGDKAPFAVKDINFEAKGGEIIGFLGPNGAGKSTTIKAIVGIHLPTEGTIEINGYDIVTQPVQAKAQLGFVPDHYALYENLTGREYLNYIADLYDVSQKDRDEYLDEFLETLQMKNFIDNKMQTYSHGMKQKIAIAASLIHNPKLWILDEPLTGLDPVSIYQVKQCLKRHAEKGNIVFFSSHLIDIVEKLCDRIVIISDHKVQDIANVHELLKKKVNLEEYYMKKTGLVTGDK